MNLSSIVLWLPRKSCFVCIIGLACLLLIAGSTAAAQSSASAPRSNDAIRQQLVAAEDAFQRTEAEVAAQNAPDAAQGGSAQNASASPSPSEAAPPQNAQTTSGSSAPAAPQGPPSEPPPTEEETHETMMQIPHGPALKIRGFFDLEFDDGAAANSLNYPLGVPARPSFREGEFDLFMISQIAEKLSFLAEMVVSTGPNNVFGIDLERFQLTYRHNQYFEISGGRFHTSIGYYNTAFHHGTWFSTATGRPFMFLFEDSGGPLPIHEVGMTASGLVPGTGKLHLHWVAEVGNGSAEIGDPLYGDGVENFASDRNRKDVNVAAYIRPEWLEGLQIGSSFLIGDLIPSNGLPPVNQTVSSVYAVLINSKWEFMNEMVLIHHQVTGGGPTYNSPMGYTQLAYHIAKYRPYFRFQEANIPSADPVTTFTGRYEGPSVGIRWDVFTYACLKAQYNRVYLRNTASQNGVELAAAFTF
jgi:hypothetical protein